MKKLPVKKIVEDVEEGARLYKSGLTLKEVGDKFGLSESGMYRRLKKAGVKMRKGGKHCAGRPLFFDAERLEKASQMYREGMTYKEIGKAIGCTAPTVGIYLRRAGVSIRKRGRPFSLNGSDLEKASQMYREGMTLKEIGAAIGFSYSTVRRSLRRAGVNIRKGRPRND